MVTNVQYDSKIERRRMVRLRRTQFSKNIPHLGFKIAHETAELEQAFELVWQQYRSVGLEGDNSSGIRLTKYNLLPDTKVFVALTNDSNRKGADTNIPRVIGTITLILDSEMGLPVEEVCGEEINRLRQQGRSMAEVVGLAIDPEYKRQEMNMVMHLFRIVFAYVRYKGIDDFLCSVTKRHIEFYRTLLLFEPVGEMKPYSYANKLEVQGHRLNMQLIERVAKKVYDSNCFDADLYSFFFTENTEYDRVSGDGCTLSPEQLRYFLIERTRMIDTLDENTLSLLRAEYKRAGCSFLDESDMVKR